MRARDFDRLLWPECAVCHKPVESMVAYDNPHEMSRAFLARCHGQSEKVVLQEEVAHAHGAGLLIGCGKAFDRPALAAPPKELGPTTP